MSHWLIQKIVARNSILRLIVRRKSYYAITVFQPQFDICNQLNIWMLNKQSVSQIDIRKTLRGNYRKKQKNHFSTFQICLLGKLFGRIHVGSCFSFWTVWQWHICLVVTGAARCSDQRYISLYRIQETEQSTVSWSHKICIRISSHSNNNNKNASSTRMYISVSIILHFIHIKVMLSNASNTNKIFGFTWNSNSIRFCSFSIN